MNSTNHFDTIAELFNRIWYFSSEYKDFVHRHIMEDLSLKSSDILADIGGGTGSFTHRLASEGHLDKAYCIEPSPSMCEEAKKYDTLIPLCTDASGFCDQELPYSKLLFKEVIHHIPNREHLWKRIHSQLPHEGKILIITRPQQIAFPFFEAAKIAFSANQPPHDMILQELNNAGFQVTLHHRSHTFTLPKEEWYTMLRHRFMSDLGVFSDEEIEAGIDEIETQHPEGIMTITDNLIFITAIK